MELDELAARLFVASWGRPGDDDSGESTDQYATRMARIAFTAAEAFDAVRRQQKSRR